ncbi:MAG TPA: hypothetical protein VF525_03240 [Pyrinomonadaceae bacterium]|jgi:hypothetical protein
MAKMYDYRVCQVQQQCVTFTNGEWQGHVPLSEAAGASDPFASCLKVWDYLQRVGPDGWELVAATTHQRPDASYDMLYLRREL